MKKIDLFRALTSCCAVIVHINTRMVSTICGRRGRSEHCCGIFRRGKAVTLDSSRFVNDKGNSSRGTPSNLEPLG